MYLLLRGAARRIIFTGLGKGAPKALSHYVIIMDFGRPPKKRYFFGFSENYPKKRFFSVFRKYYPIPKNPFFRKSLLFRNYRFFGLCLSSHITLFVTPEATVFIEIIVDRVNAFADRLGKLLHGGHAVFFAAVKRYLDSRDAVVLQFLL